MRNVLTSGKKLIAKVKWKFGRQNQLTQGVLQSPTPGTTLRSTMRDNVDDPETLDKLLDFSAVHDLRGRD